MSANRFTKRESEQRKTLERATPSTTHVPTTLDVHDSVVFTNGQPVGVTVFGKHVRIEADGKTVKLGDATYVLASRNARYQLLLVP